MDANHTLRKAPDRVIDLDAARRRHGAKADHVVTLPRNGRRAGTVLSEEQLRHLIVSVLRRAFGEEWGDRLGIPGIPAATDLMPLISQLNRQAHYWQTYSPASAPEARRALEGPAPELKAAVLPCDTSCRRNAGAVRPGA